MSTKKQSFLCVVPFSGFYGSQHDEALDNEEEQMFTFDDGQLHESLYEMFYDHMNYRDLHESYAKAYVEAISDLTELQLEFEDLHSPREYNFTTDRIFADINRKSLARALCAVRGNPLKEMAKEMFTSCSGFISFYSLSVSEWGRIESWDHNQIYCVLKAFFRYLDRGNSLLLEDQALDSICEGGAVSELIHDSASEESMRALNIFDYLRRRKERACAPAKSLSCECKAGSLFGSS